MTTAKATKKVTPTTKATNSGGNSPELVAKAVVKKQSTISEEQYSKLNKENAVLQKENEHLKNQINQLQEDLIKLNSVAANTKATVVAGGLPVVSFKGKSYRFRMKKFVLNGATVDADVAKDNDNLMETLTVLLPNGKLKYGILKLIS